MAKNLFISNFSKKRLTAILMLSRAFFAFLAFLLLTQLFFIHIANITKDETKQVIQWKRQWVRDNDFIKRAKGRDIVFFFGNSRITAGIIPEVFDEKNGHSTYSCNLALPALSLASHYFLLNDYLKKNRPPQYILIKLPSDNFNDNPKDSIQGAGFCEVLQYAFFVNNTDALSNYLWPSQCYNKEVYKYFEGKALWLGTEKTRSTHKDRYCRRFVDLETFRHDWKYFYDVQYLFPEEYLKQKKKMLERNRGYHYFIEQAAIGGRMPDDYILKRKSKSEDKDLEDSAEACDPFIGMFFTLTEKNNIKVILISDYRIMGGQEQLCSLPKEWGHIKENYKNVYFAEDGFKLRFYPPGCFSDPAHVNSEGACLYTQEIAEEFKKIVNSIKKDGSIQIIRN